MPPTSARAPTAAAPERTAAPEAAAPTSAAGMSGAAAGRAARGQSGAGNAAVAASLAPGASVNDQLPAALDLQGAGVSFQLPGQTALTGDWNQLETTDRTTVHVHLSGTALRVSFWPALNIDAQWPVSNVAWSGFSWDFTRGRMGDVGLRNTQLGFSARGTVEEAVVSFATQLLAGSPMGRAGYDPRADPDLAGTLQRIQANFQTRSGGGGGGKGGDLRAGDVSGFQLHAEAKTRSEVRAGAGSGGVRLPAGAGISVSVALAGTGATLGTAPPEVREIGLSSTDLVLESGGEPVARLRSLRIARGGVVDVLDFEPLGTLAEVGAGESLFRLLVAVAAVRGGDARGLDADLNPRLVDGVAERQMEEALSQAVQGLVRDHHDVLPGIDLRAVLGVAVPRS